ncbi:MULTISPECIES: hypothetical protein [Geobacillus]|uniref:hypothetical protein n=1 Tax=Geobacillus TaxID=129337 RepID=UPI000AE4F5E3|nr:MULTISPECIES: hypothetical protein [Geobacillus]
MEQWILWLLAALGIGLLGLSFRFLPTREGSIVAGAGLLEYPVRFFCFLYK